MTQNYFHVAIHEAGHAVAYLAEGISVDSIILDCDRLGGRVVPSEGPKSAKSDAIITLAGMMAEHVAYEKDVIDVSPTPLPDFDHAPLEQRTDDEIKYRSCIDMLRRERPDSTTKDVDLTIKHETRDLIERHWETVLKVAHAAYSAPEQLKQKNLDRTIIEKFFKQA
jgi:hypothetical protein